MPCTRTKPAFTLTRAGLVLAALVPQSPSFLTIHNLPLVIVPTLHLLSHSFIVSSLHPASTTNHQPLLISVSVSPFGCLYQCISPRWPPVLSPSTPQPFSFPSKSQTLLSKPNQIFRFLLSLLQTPSNSTALAVHILVSRTQPKYRLMLRTRS